MLVIRWLFDGYSMVIQLLYAGIQKKPDSYKNYQALIFGGMDGTRTRLAIGEMTGRYSNQLLFILIVIDKYP